MILARCWRIRVPKSVRLSSLPVALLLVGCVINGLPHVASAREPIRSHFTRDAKQRAPTNDIRLAYAIVRVPMAAMAGALSEDAGDDATFWEKRLDAWDAAGEIEVVEPSHGWERVDLKNDMELKPGYRAIHRFIGVGAAATHWYASQEARERKLEPPSQDDLLQDLSEHRFEPAPSALAQLWPDGRHVDLRMTLTHAPRKPDKRPTTTWPIPPFDASRLLFRSWKLSIEGRFAMDQLVLLGAQMEPHHEQLHTGHVLAAFARIYPPTVEGNTSGGLDGPAPGVRVQSWTLSVPHALALPWLQSRPPGADDAAVFRDWLARARAKDGVELLSTSALASRSGGQGEAACAIEWQDASGFEPAATHTDFRARPCDSNEYSLKRCLAIEVSGAGDDSGVGDPFGAARKPVAPSFWSVHFQESHPASALRWLKWKSAMERDEHDPNAVEIAEVGDRDERIESTLNLAAGQVSMIGSAMKGDRFVVTFARLVEDPATRAVPPPAVKPVPPSPMLTTWMIDTPLSWQSRLLTADRRALDALGAELLAAIGKDDVRLAGQLSATHRSDRTEPRVFFGGAYVNTAPGTNGIFFNARSVEHESVGDRVEISVADEGTRALQLHFTSIGSPAWRRWGIWQPGIAATTAENSGIERPVFPHFEIEGSWILEPREVTVIAAMRVAETVGADRGTPRIRWYVARLDADHEPPSGTDLPDRRVGRGYPSWQAAIVRVKDDTTLPADSAGALRLLADAASGAVEILDLVSIHGGDRAKANAGSDMHFTNGREWKGFLAHPEAMPSDARWHDQIHFQHHIVGLHLEFDPSADEWKIERDEQHPKIVTDTFHDAQLEWPEPLDWNAQTKTPVTTVCVQRPIFRIANAAFESDLPKAGEALARRLSPTAGLVVRRLQ